MHQGPDMGFCENRMTGVASRGTLEATTRKGV